uniref:Uncharacterized protein n=1 Tax=Cajanus cajan TaxID=3821 RepID=A0A151SSI0_CAJCA|nr:hypothetical protein KK1_004055 [Cajanus cajan]
MKKYVLKSKVLSESKIGVKIFILRFTLTLSMQRFLSNSNVSIFYYFFCNDYQ